MTDGVPLTLLSVVQLHFYLFYKLWFHLEKAFFCLKIKSKFSRPCALRQLRARTHCSLRGWLRGWVS